MITLLAVGRRGRGGAGRFVSRNRCLTFIPKRNLLKLDPIIVTGGSGKGGADYRAAL